MMGGSIPVFSQRGMVVKPAEAVPETSSLVSLIPFALDGLVYASIVLCSITAALIGTYNVDADTVAYLDLSNAIRNHRWHALVNASWFPIYPALLTLGRACFTFRPQYDIMAARLVDSVLNLRILRVNRRTRSIIGNREKESSTAPPRCNLSSLLRHDALRSLHLLRQHLLPGPASLRPWTGAGTLPASLPHGPRPSLGRI
jgi:hypothetical protein